MIKRMREIEIDLTVREISEAFCDMDADDQACFFNHLAAITAEWKQHFCFQLQAITDSPMLSDAGRSVMNRIGIYSVETKVKNIE